MDAPQFGVADIFREFGEAYRRDQPVSHQQRVVMRAIELCRTPTLGGHIFRCDGCGVEKHVYNSCGNRHCPNCQALSRAQWLHDRARELLPVPYFHLVFTLPHTLHPLARANQRLIYRLLFQTAHRALLDTAANPEYLGAHVGGVSLLHTWGSRGIFHPHIHSIAQGGGPSTEGHQWVNASESFFVPVKVLSAAFKKAFVDALEKAWRCSELWFSDPIQDLQHPVCFNDFLDELRYKNWVVFAKAPFSGPEDVLHYLGRYTHRVAISNERLVRREGEYVLFRYKDYKRGERWRIERVHAFEFIRRFLLHVLPYRFVRIRYCGQLANRHKRENLERSRAQLGVPPPEPPPAREDPVERCRRLTGRDLSRCTVCGEGRLVLRCSTPRPRLSELVSRPRRAKAPGLMASPRTIRGPPAP